MSGSGSGNKNVTGVGKAIEAFLRQNDLSVSALSRALHEIDPDTDPETYRRNIQRWLKGQSLRSASVASLDKAFKHLKVPESFKFFLSGLSEPPLPNPLPQSPEEWTWLALHDHAYVQGAGMGWTDWDEDQDMPVTYKPPAVELRVVGAQIALKVWTFFKRINYRWERDDCLDRIYRKINRRLSQELLYRSAFLLQDIEYESYENAQVLAAWLACKQLAEVASDPNWEEPSTIFVERVSQDGPSET